MDRQLRSEAILQKLLISGDAADNAVHVASVAKESINKVEELSTKIDKIVSNLERRLDHHGDMCGLFIKSSSAAIATKPSSPVAAHDHSEPAHALNVVISGIPEDRSTAILRGKIKKVLSCAASHDVCGLFDKSSSAAVASKLAPSVAGHDILNLQLVTIMH